MASSTRKAKDAQEKQQSERRRKEEAARPDPMHRAMIFVLRQISLNNRDAKPEADHHIAALDKKGANPEKLEEIETPSGAPVEVPAPASEETSETASLPDSNPIQRSRRFSRS